MIGDVCEHFVCDCHWLEHQLVFEYMPGDPDNPYVHVSLHLVPKSLWRRIKDSFLYIIGRDVPAWEEIVLNEDAVKRLHQMTGDFLFALSRSRIIQ